MNHTKGPWSCSKAGFDGCDEGEVAYYVQMDDPVISLANCRLIAAAPELLEALKLAVNEMQTCRCDGTDLILADCERAIAKATGATP